MGETRRHWITERLLQGVLMKIRKSAVSAEDIDELISFFPLETEKKVKTFDPDGREFHRESLIVPDWMVFHMKGEGWRRSHLAPKDKPIQRTLVDWLKVIIREFPVLQEEILAALRECVAREEVMA